MASRKLGRNPRKFDMRIPRARTLIRMAGDLLPVPPTLDYSDGLPADLGEFLNDALGNCTCAAFYHARQIWTAIAGGEMITDPDVDSLQMYEAACGYKPGDASTDNGGVEQDVLAYLLNIGAPTKSGIDKILAYTEIDQRNFEELKRVIYECGIAYIGINVPQSVMDNADNNDISWDVSGNQEIIGGHAIILVGYDDLGFWGISWGKKYKLTNEFLFRHLDEAYGIIDQAWVKATGSTPLGMSIPDLEIAMQALKDAA